MTASISVDGAESPHDGSRFAEIDAALVRGDAETARQLTKTLLRDGAVGAGPLTEAGAVLRLAYCDLAQSQVQRAHSGAREAAKLLRETIAKADEVDALALCARTASVLGRSVEAVETALLATKLADELPAGPCTARAYQSLGVAYGWGRAFAQAARAFETAAQVVERHGDPAARLEVIVIRSWVQLLRWTAERRGQGRSPRSEASQHLADLQQAGATAGSSSALTPGTASSLSSTVNLVSGLMAFWSGDLGEAEQALARCAEAGSTPLGWALSVQSWLRAELAIESGDLDAASMHATRMAALASELGHLPLECLGHELTSDIYLRQGRADLALEEQRRQLECERVMRSHDLEACTEVADLHVAARQGGARIAELAAKSMKYEKWAHEDPLTGIANLRRFNQCLTEWSAASEDAGRPLCVALIDVNKFRDINNNFSYEAGNQALRGIADEMSANVRPAKDLVARWGGDEFAVLLRDTDLEEALKVAQRIQQAVKQRDWDSVAEGLDVEISVGVTEARAGDDKAAIIARSEELMYAQKVAARKAEVYQAVPQLVLRTATAWLRGAERVLVFVGAGTAAEGKGFTRFDGIASSSLEDRVAFHHVRGLQSNPKGFAEFWEGWRQAKRGRKPSQAHTALVELSHRLPQVLFVTERVDGVLAMAGAENVIELYGNAFRHRCGACGAVSGSMEKGCCLACDSPQSTIRPDIVLLGEEVDRRLLAGAELNAKRSDVILVVDCDATTHPGAGLLEKARIRGARVVMLGGSRTQRGVADLSIAASPEVVARFLAEALDEGSANDEAGSALSPDGFDMYCFLTGQRADNLGVTLERTMAWKDWEIETHLGTVPWMFPLPTRSQMNPAAPMPSRADFEVLAADEQVRGGMKRAFDLMLRFYGFEWRNGKVEKAEGWRNGFATWAITPSHHDLFISRILGALSLTGLKDEAAQFLKALEIEAKQYRGDSAHGPLWHWRLAVNGGDRKAA